MVNNAYVQHYLGNLFGFIIDSISYSIDYLFNFIPIYTSISRKPKLFKTNDRID